MLKIEKLMSISNSTLPHNILLGDTKIGLIDLNKQGNYVEVVNLLIYDEYKYKGYGKKAMIILNKHYNLFGDSLATAVGFFQKIGATFDSEEHMIDNLEESAENGILYPISILKGYSYRIIKGYYE